MQLYYLVTEQNITSHSNKSRTIKAIEGYENSVFKVQETAILPHTINPSKS